MDSRKEFLNYQAQTNNSPFLIEVDRAEGVYIHDKNDKRYLDMIAGVAVNNIGHNHPKVVEAIKNQVDKHLHVMVYGEFIQDAPLHLCKKLCSLLPKTLNSVYVLNSGTEANEAALKLAKRVTKRSELIAFKGAYHGSTHGSLSVSGNETKKEAFRPLLPDVHFLDFNAINNLEYITENTAGVIIETVQGDAGVRIPSKEFMAQLRRRCDKVGAVLIFDEVQCGIGRTGKMFAFEHFDVTPDILTLGKALGGGMPIGALISSKEYLDLFAIEPALGHISTFGGHPVSCAAALACLQVMTDEIDFDEVERLGRLLENLLSTIPEIIAIRRIGMMFALDMDSPETVAAVVQNCLDYGLISFWFLSHPSSMRLSPPLIITENQIITAAEIIKKSVKE